MINNINNTTEFFFQGMKKSQENSTSTEPTEPKVFAFLEEKDNARSFSFDQVSNCYHYNGNSTPIHSIYEFFICWNKFSEPYTEPVPCSVYGSENLVRHIEYPLIISDSLY